jgi:hypothetical protein
MTAKPNSDDYYSPEEAERRARATAHRLLNTPPRPHMTKRQEAERAAQSGRAPQPGDKRGDQ